MADFEEHFRKLKEDEAERVRAHQRSVVHNQLERVRVGVQEAGDEDLVEDFETLEILIDKLIKIALPD